ncbi:MAG: MaoC family dehydratase N-terminal domain-containing protein [Dehalococcoidia bacterium]
MTENSIHTGRDFGRRDYVVTPELVARYCGAVDDHYAIYTGPSPFGGPVAPALVKHSEVYDYRDHPKGQPSWYLPNLYGNLHARQEFEFFAPVLVGDAIHTRSFIADRYVKRGRDYVVNEILYFDADDRIVMRGRTHQSFLVETNNEGIVVDKTREKSSERRFDVAVAARVETLPPLRKQITDEMCFQFTGPYRNYHNDREMAAKLGFPDLVVQGMMTICFLSQMMTERFGAGWISAGKLDVRLVNVVWGRDALTCGGYIREITPEGVRSRAHADIWAEKDDGTKVVVGAASALV